MKTLYLKDIELSELDLDFSYEPAQSYGPEQEPLNESITLTKCHYKGIDLIPLIDEEQITELEEWAMEERRDNAAESYLSNKLFGNRFGGI